jgi:hypothetical protein
MGAQNKTPLPLHEIHGSFRTFIVLIPRVDQRARDDGRMIGVRL